MESLRVFWGELEAFRYGVILLFVLTLTYIYHVIRRCVIVSRKVKPIDKQEHEGVSVIITSHNNAECSPQFAFSTWLFKIASNNTIDFIRKKKAKIVSLDKDDINPDDRGYINSVPADVLNPEEETIRKQRAEFMREKVAMLKGRYRKLIELRYFEEYSYEEIAQELAIPLGTVKAQLFRARELLLNILQNSEIARENERV